MSWSRCRVEGDWQDPASFKVDNGSRPLTASEQGGAETALRGVRVSAGTGCGADKPSWELAVASAGGSITYGDDFYACVPNYEHFVESEGLLGALHGARSSRPGSARKDYALRTG